MSGISILIASRRKDNPNSDLTTFLQSLSKKTFDPNQIEVLLRFDEDDEVSDLVKTLKSYPFSIKYLIGSRGQGYEDLCRYYNELLPLTNPKFTIVMCAADDMVVLEDSWEQSVFKAAKGAGDLFIIHQWLPNLHLSYSQLPSNLHRVDEIPIWSRKLLEITKGIGCAGPSDSWTVILEWGLKHGFGKSITRYIHRKSPIFAVIDRKICKADLERRQFIPTSFGRSLETIPEYQQILRLAKYKMGLWPYWNRLYLYLQKLFGKIIHRPIDVDGISLHAPEEMIYLIEEDYYGYNISCSKGVFYGIPQALGELILANVQSMQNYLHVFSSHSLDEVKNRCRDSKLEYSILRRWTAQFKKWIKILSRPVR